MPGHVDNIRPVHEGLAFASASQRHSKSVRGTEAYNSSSFPHDWVNLLFVRNTLGRLRLEPRRLVIASDPPPAGLPPPGPLPLGLNGGTFQRVEEEDGYP